MSSTETPAAEAAITVSRAEAVALSTEMRWTSGDNMIGDDLGKRSVVHEAIRRLQLESALRDALGWWRPDEPGLLHVQAHCGGECPDSWPLTAAAVDLLAELLPTLIAEQDIELQKILPHWSAEDVAEHREFEGECKRLLESVAVRLGVQVKPEAVTA